jgi:hypothetical protein
MLVFSMLTSLSGAAFAGPDRQSALADCRDEAVSTGLENEEDIQYYVELCMQSFAGDYADAEYMETPTNAPAEDTGDSSR